MSILISVLSFFLALLVATLNWRIIKKQDLLLHAFSRIHCFCDSLDNYFLNDDIKIKSKDDIEYLLNLMDREIVSNSSKLNMDLIIIKYMYNDEFKMCYVMVKMISERIQDTLLKYVNNIDELSFNEMTAEYHEIVSFNKEKMHLIRSEQFNKIDIALNYPYISFINNLPLYKNIKQIFLRKTRRATGKF